MTMDVVVIGGGVIGASVAYRLALEGARVTLLEAARPGGGTTASSFAWVNANGKLPREYFELNLAGMHEHAAVAEELGEASWFHPGGDLEWSDAEEGKGRLGEKVDRIRGWGYRVEWRTRDELRGLEPDLLVQPADEDGTDVAHYLDESWIHPVLLVGVLLRAARERGAMVRGGARVTRLNVLGGRVDSVETADGERYDADVVVDCAGPQAAEVAELAGSSLPMRNSMGLLTVTEPVAATVSHVVHAPGIYFRPDGAGRLMLGSRAADKAPMDGAAGSPDSAVSLAMIEAARRVVPALAGVRIESARLGTRAIPADGLPAVGHLPGVENCYAVVTHSGITLSLLLGRLAAREIVGGVEEEWLRDLRPSRLVTTVR